MSNPADLAKGTEATSARTLADLMGRPRGAPSASAAALTRLSDLARQALDRPDMFSHSISSARQAAELDRHLATVAETAQARDDAKFELMRRQTLAAEAALATAHRSEADARRQAERAYAIAWVSAVVGLAALLVAAWPYITAWWQ